MMIGKKHACPTSLVLWAGLMASIVPCSFAAWPHADPPPDDPCLVQRFGRSWSQPITNGYLIVGNRYIDAPYIVEQRGYVILVNNLQVAYGVAPRWVLPLPPPEPVLEDPGMPTDLTETNSVYDVMRHDITKRKMRYWKGQELQREELADAYREYMESLPCIERVGPYIRSGMEGHFGVHDIHDNMAGIMLWNEPGSHRPKPPPLTDKELRGAVLHRMRQYERALKADLCVRSNGAGPPATSLRVGIQKGWQEGFRVLQGVGTPLEKANRIFDLGLFQRTDTPVQTLDGFLPLDEFHASDQIHQRARGDSSWTNGIPAYLGSVTNGWQQIPPAWERE
jgi:hypothetical protein